MACVVAPVSVVLSLDLLTMPMSRRYNWRKDLMVALAISLTLAVVCGGAALLASTFIH